jgi:hypothetical protein
MSILFRFRAVYESKITARAKKSRQIFMKISDNRAGVKEPKNAKNLIDAERRSIHNRTIRVRYRYHIGRIGRKSEQQNHMNIKKAIRPFILLSVISLTVAAQAAGTATLTVLINGRGSVSPTYKGKALNINQDYTIKATAAAGFKFSDWIVTGPSNTTTNTTARLTFQMVSNLQLTANFVDIQLPTVTITTKKSTGSNSVVAISGTAKDNVGVVSVWCQAGSSGWNLAETSDGYTNWTAYLILGDGQNIIQAYAEDAAGNRSTTKTVTVGDNSTGFAPESLAGTTVQLGATNGDSRTVSFGGSTFSATGSHGPGVGIYTYTMIDANTGQWATFYIGPPEKASVSDVLTLNFTNGTSGSFTDTNGLSGTFTLSDASSTAPASLSGLTLAYTGTNGSQFTNELGDGTFMSTENSESSGTYTYTRYSPVAGLLQETLTNAADLGKTNYGLLNFSTGSNTYYVQSDTTNGNNTSAGTFTVSGETSTEGYMGPESLDGLSAAVTAVGTNGRRTAFKVSFDASTFGQFEMDTNTDSGVGTYTFTRTGPKTALFLNHFLAPPEDVINDGVKPASFTFTSSHSANFISPDSHGTITFSEKAATAPLSLVGRTIAGSNKGHTGGYSFGYGIFNGIGHDSSEAGNYTCAIYGPQVAMAILNYTDASDAGTTEYLLLWFSSATGGSYRDNNTSGHTETGTFTMK